MDIVYQLNKTSSHGMATHLAYAGIEGLLLDHWALYRGTGTSRSGFLS